MMWCVCTLGIEPTETRTLETRLDFPGHRVSPHRLKVGRVQETYLSTSSNECLWLHKPRTLGCTPCTGCTGQRAETGLSRLELEPSVLREVCATFAQSRLECRIQQVLHFPGFGPGKPCDCRTLNPDAYFSLIPNEDGCLKSVNLCIIGCAGLACTGFAKAPFTELIFGECITACCHQYPATHTTTC